jgi:mono/diheme cytochrome c family protein
MKTLKILLVVAALGISTMFAVIYSGGVNVAADEPHSKFIYWVLEETRERAIAKASADIEVPDLSDPELLLAGGVDYGFMCESCHLKPGQKESDMSVGLYPAPPNLAIEHQAHNEDSDREKARNFWIIKHGIKASGMPAWGKTHDDKRIWAMVAFIERLPKLSPEEYQILTAID